MATDTIGGTGGDGTLPVLTSIDRTSDLFPFYSVANAETAAITPNNILGITGAPVGTSDSQTLTNKILTSPTISGPTLSGTLSGTYTIGGTPTFPSSVVTLTGSQTLTNKVLTSPTINTAVISNPTLTVDAISGYSSATVVSVANLSISNGVLNTNNSVITSNITDSNVTPAKLQSGTGSTWAWSSWTPSWTNLTVGNGTLNYSTYIQIGKTVHFKIQLTFGSTTTIGGSVSVSLPVTAQSNEVGQYVGIGNALQSGVNNYNLAASIVSTTTVAPFAYVASGGYTNPSQVTSTVPFSWAVNNVMTFRGTYEAA